MIFFSSAMFILYLIKIENTVVNFKFNGTESLKNNQLSPYQIYNKV
jgi:hypothetical protein